MLKIESPEAFSLAEPSSKSKTRFDPLTGAAVVFFLLSTVFVWRSFYAMRIQSSA